jgi:hypothetical protein
MALLQAVIFGVGLKESPIFRVENEPVGVYPQSRKSFTIAG